MKQIFDSRTATNASLRFCVGAILLIVQCGTMSTGCAPNPGATPPPTDVDPTPGDGDGDGDVTNPDDPKALDDLVGAWAVERRSGEEESWGIAIGATLLDDSMSLQIYLDEAAGPITFTLTDTTAGLTGEWISPVETGSFTGTANDTGQRIEGTLTVAGTADSLVLYRGAEADYRASAVWTRSDDGATAIVAADLDSVLISVLEGDDWTTEGRYDGYYSEGGAALLNEAFSYFGADASGQGLFFDNGRQLMLVDRQSNATLTPAVSLFERTDDAGELTGLWVGLDRQYAGDLPYRSVRRVVEHDGHLFVHEGGQSSEQPLTRLQVLRNIGLSYIDETPGQEWTGKLSSSDNRMLGQWVGYDDEWYSSMDRTATPTPEDLTGTFGSVDINHTFSEIEPRSGSAVLNFDGTTLNIVDTNQGEVFEMLATWTGDHFEGTWWNQTTPETAFPWRGQWLAEGGFLHGLWSEGEWSFSTNPIATTDEVGDANILFVADPAADRLMTVVDEVTNHGMTILRDQERITQMIYSTEAGEIAVAVDERLRPTQIAGADETVDIVWADSGTHFSATVTNNGTGDTQSYAGEADFSDANIIALFDAQELATGRDFSAARKWIEDNPGELDLIASTGRMTVVDDGLTGLSKAAETVEYRVDLSQYTSVNNAAFQGSTYLLAVASALSAIGAGAGVVAAVTGAAAVLALVVVGALLFDLLWWLFTSGECCTPCGLGCFFNCCWDKPN